MMKCQPPREKPVEIRIDSDGEEESKLKYFSPSPRGRAQTLTPRQQHENASNKFSYPAYSANGDTQRSKKVDETFGFGTPELEQF